MTSVTVSCSSEEPPPVQMWAITDTLVYSSALSHALGGAGDRPSHEQSESFADLQHSFEVPLTSRQAVRNREQCRSTIDLVTWLGSEDPTCSDMAGQ